MRGQQYRFCMQRKTTRTYLLGRHRHLLAGVLCLLGVCLLSAQDKKTETPEKKKTRVDLLFAEEAQSDQQARPNVQVLVGSVKTLGLLPGIIRPCISALVPLFNGQNMLILDVGLNTDAKPEMLCQFAVLGSLYAKTVMGVARPRVALLNIGAEPGKGDSTTVGAYRMLEKGGGDFDFVGNMEANALFNGGMADVLVTEGFVGNICLKQTEGMYELIARLGVAHPFFKRFNYEYYGGTPVLGITAPVVIGHGVSTPVAIKNMILEAEKVVKCDLVSRLKDALAIENKGM